MSTTVSSTGITFPDSTALRTNPIPSGTVTIFNQTSSPTGWTKVTTYNDYAIRVVSGAVVNRTNGIAFSSVFTNQIPSGTITGAQTNPVQVSGTTGTSEVTLNIGQTTIDLGLTPQTSVITSASLSNANHSHNFSSDFHSHSVSGSFSGNSLNFSLNYVDVILASKN